MDTRFKEISMNGRMAYLIMCVEAFLVNKYPNRNWTLIAEAMWNATSNNWGDWPDYYSAFIPSVLFEYDKYNTELASSFSEEDYLNILALYDGITDGLEDDLSDEVSFMINLPYEMAMIYEGTTIGDGEDSYEIIRTAENILSKNNIPFPDYEKLTFSSFEELNGWGNDFDGRYLSIII